MSLKNKVVVITGGGSGIGEAATKAFLEAGTKLVINGRRADKLEALATRMDPKHENVTSQFAIGAMLNRGAGTVINIGSMWANHAIAGRRGVSRGTARMVPGKNHHPAAPADG